MPWHTPLNIAERFWQFHRRAYEESRDPAVRGMVHSCRPDRGIGAYIGESQLGSSRLDRGE